jgi:DNA-binding SARP family transcriptional activator
LRATEQRWRIELLGGLRAQRGDRVVTRFRTQKNVLLLAYLALYSQHPQPREVLIELFWPEIDPELGRNNLRSSLHALRRELEPPGSEAGTVLIADRQSIRLDPAAFTTDVAEFRQALRTAGQTTDPEQQAPLLKAAVTQYRGELLPGLFEPWVLTERQQLAERYLEALHQLVAALEQAGDLSGALEAARRAVAFDPLREEAHYDLMRLYAAAGQPRRPCSSIAN